MKRHAWLALLVCSATAQGQNYPYSIHPFGVHSPEEFNQVRRDFPDQYKQYGAVHIAQLRRDRHWYVSYLNGNVYWTSKPLLIRAREYLWTDGWNDYIRARCGNQLSSLPMSPTETLPPLETAFDIPIPDEDSLVLPWTPEISRALNVSNPRTPTAPGTDDVTPAMPLAFWPLIVGDGTPQRHRRTVVPPAAAASTPEPNTIPLILLGLVLLFFIREYRMRKI